MTQSIVEAATEYVEAGLCVYPVNTESKKPLIRGWNWAGAARNADAARELFSRFDDPGLGIACGPSDLTLVDIDPRNGGTESFRKLADRIGLECFDAPQVATPGGGIHIYYRGSIPGIHESQSVKSALGRGIDVITAGGGVVAPPTVRSTGAYTWRDPSALIRGFDAPHVPEQLAVIIRNRAAQRRRLVGEGILPAVIYRGERNAILTRFGGRLRKIGATEIEISAALCRANADRCRPALTDTEVQVIARSVASYKPTTDASAWLASWLPALSKNQLRVAGALYGIADFLTGPMTPAAVVVCRKAGLDENAYFKARKELEELGAIRVLNRGRKYAPIIELCLPQETPIGENFGGLI